MEKNDEIIVKLQEKIAAKKASLTKTRPSWETNGLINWTGAAKNLHVLASEQELVSLFADLVQTNEGFKKANAILGLNESFQWGGFSFEAWQKDFTTRAILIKENAEQAKLRAMEKQLGELESAALKTQKSLANIEKELSL